MNGDVIQDLSTLRAGRPVEGATLLKDDVFGKESSTLKLMAR